MSLREARHRVSGVRSDQAVGRTQSTPLERPRRRLTRQAIRQASARRYDTADVANQMRDESMSGRSHEFRADLAALPASLFVSRWLLERVPFLFADDFNEYVDWKHYLSERLGVDPRAICLVGSAAAGVSLSPQRALRPFTESSDVDVALISAHHFDIVWLWLRSLGAERYKLPRYAQEQIEDHRERLVYWGAIATDRLLQYTPLGKTWVPALDAAAAKLPGGRRDVNVRLFRDHEALRSYQINCCDLIRKNL